MRLLGSVSFLALALYAAVVAACVHAYMILTVMRVVRFRNVFEMHFPRLWREHKAHFPDSKIRATLLLLIAVTIVFLLLEKLLG